MEEILKVEDLSIIYKTDLETVYAVNGISFSLKQGETMGLVGESGCGKTTVGRALLRLYDIEEGGKILFDGTDISRLNGLFRSGDL